MEFITIEVLCIGCDVGIHAHLPGGLEEPLMRTHFEQGCFGPIIVASNRDILGRATTVRWYSRVSASEDI